MNTFHSALLVALSVVLASCNSHESPAPTQRSVEVPASPTPAAVAPKAPTPMAEKTVPSEAPPPPEAKPSVFQSVPHANVPEGPLKEMLCKRNAVPKKKCSGATFQFVGTVQLRDGEAPAQIAVFTDLATSPTDEAAEPNDCLVRSPCFSVVAEENGSWRELLPTGGGAIGWAESTGTPPDYRDLIVSASNSADEWELTRYRWHPPTRAYRQTTTKTCSLSDKPNPASLCQQMRDEFAVQ